VVTLRSSERTPQHEPVRYGVGKERPWLVIPARHRAPVRGLPEDELVVLSFHTVLEEDLLEVCLAGECTYTDPAET
jgi:hypothetical protein